MKGKDNVKDAGLIDTPDWMVDSRFFFSFIYFNPREDHPLYKAAVVTESRIFCLGVDTNHQECLPKAALKTP